MMTKVLVIDNDNSICELFRMFLANEGCEVRSAHDGVEGFSAFRMYEPDIVITEVTLPKKDGLQLCREIREISNKPLIMISNKGEVIDKILGLELGADDYVVKPFDIKEVYARMKAVLRRVEKKGEEDGELIRFENLEISLQRYELRVEGKHVDLPPKELELLYFLASNYNRVFTRDQLLDKVWSFDYLGDSRTVDVHIKRLREKLTGVSEQWSLDTVWGVGYKFKVNVD